MLLELVSRTVSAADVCVGLVCGVVAVPAESRWLMAVSWFCCRPCLGGSAAGLVCVADGRSGGCGVGAGGVGSQVGCLTRASAILVDTWTVPPLGDLAGGASWERHLDGVSAADAAGR